MKRIVLSFIFVLISVTGSASEISQITLSELQEKADLIVLGQVIELIEDGDQDKVTIQVDSFMKGTSDKNFFSFSLISRGGLKDFDPALNIGDNGVFFLKLKDQGVEKAYWGSIAIFAKNNFVLTNSNEYLDFLESWKTHRLEKKQLKY